MPSLSEAYPEFLEALEARYGRPALPAGRDGFEAVARAYLEHQLGASKADVVLGQLRDAGLLDAPALSALDQAELPAVLEGAKDSPRWVGLLRKLSAWYVEQEGAEGLEEVPTESLRDSLRGLKGIGPGSVDVVLLRGLGRAAMPVERGSARVLVRHGWIDTSQSYDEIRQTLESLAPDDPPALEALADGLNRVAGEFCKTAGPRCERCPLRLWLPESGPVEPM